MTSKEVQSLYDLIDYLFDKMHIAVELTGNEVISLVSDFSEKVIAWTILSNSIKIIITAIIAITLTNVGKKLMKKYDVKNVMQTGFKADANTKQYKTAVLYCFIFCAVVVLITALIVMIGFSIAYIIQSMLFPEKVVLDFIANYF